MKSASIPLVDAANYLNKFSHMYDVPTAHFEKISAQNFRKLQFSCIFDYKSFRFFSSYPLNSWITLKASENTTSVGISPITYVILVLSKHSV